MNRPITELAPVIRLLYQKELGGDPEELVRLALQSNGTAYELVRNDDTRTFIARKDIEDYLDNPSPQPAKRNILAALQQFKPID